MLALHSAPAMAKPNVDAARHRAAIQHFIDEQGLQVTAWCRRAKLSEGTLRNFLSGRTGTMTVDSLERLAAAASVSLSEMLGEPPPAPRSAPPAAAPGSEVRPAPDVIPFGTRDLPVLGGARGGLTDQGLLFNEGFARSFVYRPMELLGVRDAYAVYVVGDSMAPVFRNGHLVYVDPGRPPAPGDDVIVQLVNGQGFIKELVRRSEKAVICRQHNPDATVEYRKDTVKALHLIVSATRIRV